MAVLLPFKGPMEDNNPLDTGGETFQLVFAYIDRWRFECSLASIQSFSIARLHYTHFNRQTTDLLTKLRSYTKFLASKVQMGAVTLSSSNPPSATADIRENLQ